MVGDGAGGDLPGSEIIRQNPSHSPPHENMPPYAANSNWGLRVPGPGGAGKSAPSCLFVEAGGEATRVESPSCFYTSPHLLPSPPREPPVPQRPNLPCGGSARQYEGPSPPLSSTWPGGRVGPKSPGFVVMFPLRTEAGEVGGREVARGSWGSLGMPQGAVPLATYFKVGMGGGGLGIRWVPRA